MIYYIIVSNYKFCVSVVVHTDCNQVSDHSTQVYLDLDMYKQSTKLYAT